MLFGWNRNETQMVIMYGMTRSGLRRASHRTIADVLGLVGILICAAGASGHAAPPAETAPVERPNIVFIYTDDQAEWTLGVSGNEQAHTPNIDRLADEGAYLTNAFVTTPVCSPARAALMTSRYASEFDILDFITQPGHTLYDPKEDIGLPPQTRTFPEVLQKAGYRTGLVGKWHVGDWTQSDHETYHPTNHGFDYFMGLTGGGTTPENPTLEEGGVVRTFEGLTTDILTDHGIDFIERNADGPFLLSLHYRAPHGRWLPVADEDWAPFAELDPQIPNPDYPDLDVERVKRRMKEYLASVAGVDRNVGRVMATLDRLGLRDNTIVVFTSDHGYNMGHNGIEHKGNGIWITRERPTDTANIPGKYRPNLYDNSLRVPAIVRWPGVVAPGTVIDETVSSLDWYPTLTEMAGAPMPYGVTIRGQSIVPLLAGEEPEDWDNGFYAEYSMINYAQAYMRAYRTPEWKLVRDFMDPARDELYHLAVDPQERHNAIGSSPEARSAEQQLHARILAKLKEIGDPLLDVIDPATGAPGSTYPPASKWIGADEEDRTRPNVLFIAVDDMRADLGAYGHPFVQTPNLDQLASTGTVFKRAYVPQALCNPSRASIMTGLRPDRLGITDLRHHFRESHPDIVTLPQLFKEHGYHAEGIGKIYHNWAQHDWKGDSLSWSVPQVMHYATHGSDSAVVEGPLPPELARTPRTMMREVPDDAYFDGRIAELAVHALEEHQDEPFFLGVGFWKPHAPFNAPKKYWDLYDREEIGLALHSDPPSNVPAIAMHESREIFREYTDRASGEPTPEEKITLRHGYYAAISYLDAQVGKVVHALDSLGLRDNTIIVFWSDHGYHLGEQGLWSKRTNFELDARSPLIIAAPGQSAAGAKTESLVELLDIYPTLADLADLPAPAHLEGKSLRPLLNDPTQTVKQAAFTQHPAPAYSDENPTGMGYSMRTDRYRYTEWRSLDDGHVIARELYDHQEDPLETRNVADGKPDVVAMFEPLLLDQFPRRSGRPTVDEIREAVEADAPPNMLFVLVDDIGWKDVGYNGARLAETPNLDRLADEGLSFTQAYAPAPICSASRAAILTGKSPARLNFEFVTKYVDSKPKLTDLPLRPPPFTLNLPLSEITIPEALKAANYTSGFFGKWHVSAHHERYLGWSPTHGPAQQGFDVAVEDFGGHTYNEYATAPAESFAPGEYPGDSMTDRAIHFIENQDGPFYLQVNHFYAHTPVRTQAQWLTDKYAQKLREGEPVRHAEFAAFVDIVDHHVGRLLDALERSGLADETVVVLMSDNGGDPRYTEHEPLRGHKWTLYEGGIRVPLLVRWPGVVKPGARTDLPVIGTDLLPTFADIAGVGLDPTVALDGRSLVSLLRGEEPEDVRDRRMVWHFPYYHPETPAEDASRTVGTNDAAVPFVEPHSAIRQGRYKLIRFYESGRNELYDLWTDLEEQRDLSGSQPDRASELGRALDAYLDEADARLPEPVHASATAH